MALSRLSGTRASNRKIGGKSFNYHIVVLVEYLFKREGEEESGDVMDKRNQSSEGEEENRQVVFERVQDNQTSRAPDI